MDSLPCLKNYTTHSWFFYEGVDSDQVHARPDPELWSSVKIKGVFPKLPQLTKCALTSEVLTR